MEPQRNAYRMSIEMSTLETCSTLGGFFGARLNVPQKDIWSGHQ